jgi:hypothetical protein
MKTNTITTIGLAVLTIALAGCTVFPCKKTTKTPPTATAKAKVADTKADGADAKATASSTASTNASSSAAPNRLTACPLPAKPPVTPNPVIPSPTAGTVQAGPCLIINPGEDVTLTIIPRPFNKNQATFTCELPGESFSSVNVPPGEWECTATANSGQAIGHFVLVVSQEPIHTYEGGGRSGAYHAIKTIEKN